MPQKRKSEGGGVGPHVRALRGNRTDFEPEILKTVAQFLVLLNQRYVAAAAAAAGRHGEVNSNIRRGMHKRYSSLADAAGVFLEDAAAAWSRIAWTRAGDALDELLTEAARNGAADSRAAMVAPGKQPAGGD